MAMNALAHPEARVRPAVQRISATVSSMQQSVPAAFAVARSSFSIFPHLPGTPPLFARQAFHSFFRLATSAIVLQRRSAFPILLIVLGQ